LLLQFEDQPIDALDGQCIETLRDKAAVALDFRVELLALLAHGSPAGLGAGSVQHSLSPMKSQGNGAVMERLYVLLTGPDSNKFRERRNSSKWFHCKST
jgi:hypothetical protein